MWDLWFTAFPFLTGDAGVLCYAYVLRYDTCVKDVMIGGCDDWARVATSNGNVGINVCDTATRRCYEVY